MTYLTLASMIALFGTQEMLELSQLHDPDATEPDNERIQANIDSAEAEANSYLAGRYSLPFALVPLVLKEKVADIARYKLDSIRAREDVRQRYEDAIRWLKLVAAGTIDLGLDDGGEEVSIAASPAAKGGRRNRAFTDTSLKGFC